MGGISLKSNPAVFPWIFQISLIVHDGIRDDEEALALMQFIGFASDFESTLAIQNIMDFVMIPHGWAEVVTRCAGFGSIMKELQILERIVFEHICNQGIHSCVVHFILHFNMFLVCGYEL
ncbi:hypothetical protein D3C76_1601040 [compost metagenome]